MRLGLNLQLWASSLVTLKKLNILHNCLNAVLNYMCISLLLVIWLFYCIVTSCIVYYCMLSLISLIRPEIPYLNVFLEASDANITPFHCQISIGHISSSHYCVLPWIGHLCGCNQKAMNKPFPLNFYSKSKFRKEKKNF